MREVLEAAAEAVRIPVLPDVHTAVQAENSKCDKMYRGKTQGCDCKKGMKQKQYLMLLFHPLLEKQFAVLLTSFTNSCFSALNDSSLKIADAFVSSPCFCVPGMGVDPEDGCSINGQPPTRLYSWKFSRTRWHTQWAKSYVYRPYRYHPPPDRKPW